MKKLHIVGGGWAGLAAAVRATQRGWQVHLSEAAPALGGRARRIQHAGLTLDNGPHVLIGAYTDTFALLRTVGINPHTALLRQPLTLLDLQGQGLALSDAPPPWNVLLGLWRAQGWPWSAKWGLLRWSLHWQTRHFVCSESATVRELCVGLDARVVQQLIDPLCESALNTPSAMASGQVFLRVLKDALFSSPGSSDVWLPRIDLSALFPDAAHRWLLAHGATVNVAERVTTCPLPGDAVDAVVLACSPWESAKLVRSIAPAWAATAADLQHQAITSVYVRAEQVQPGAARLPRPLLALQSSPEAPAQMVLDKGQLSPDPALQGVLAFVVSASQGTRQALTQAVLQQAQAQLGLHNISWLTTVVEKRATLSCTPQLLRPSAWIAPSLAACGDYVQGPYPSTLEGAVRSGWQVIDQLGQ